ncbi:hypothetical protein [Desulfosporosinus sp. BG]|uniref:hypothetical protein n=1 Tax=Desulfosporosinus sp. BG TaxID=1633135 RepID=UPI00159F24AC|nr:hypothetical protein [Desulfosporosinus sp. BG]
MSSFCTRLRVPPLARWTVRSAQGCALPPMRQGWRFWHDSLQWRLSPSAVL